MLSVAFLFYVVLNNNAIRRRQGDLSLFRTGADLVSLPLYRPGGQVVDTAFSQERLFIDVSNVLGKDKIVRKECFKRFSPG